MPEMANKIASVAAAARVAESCERRITSPSHARICQSPDSVRVGMIEAAGPCRSGPMVAMAGPSEGSI